MQELQYVGQKEVSDDKTYCLVQGGSVNDVFMSW